jgi:hypothetical protein
MVLHGHSNSELFEVVILYLNMRTMIFSLGKALYWSSENQHDQYCAKPDPYRMHNDTSSLIHVDPPPKLMVRVKPE